MRPNWDGVASLRNPLQILEIEIGLERVQYACAMVRELYFVMKLKNFT
jgi:hypothetical protein